MSSVISSVMLREAKSSKKQIANAAYTYLQQERRTILVCYLLLKSIFVFIGYHYLLVRKESCVLCELINFCRENGSCTCYSRKPQPLVVICRIHLWNCRNVKKIWHESASGFTPISSNLLRVKYMPWLYQQKEDGHFSIFISDGKSV